MDTIGMRYIMFFYEATAVGMRETRSEQYNSYKNYFQIWRENQDFGHQHIPMSRPPLHSTPNGTKTTNGIMSQLESIHIGTKTPESTPQIQPTESPTQPMKYSKQ